MKKKNAGYTLVELLISVTVLALIAVPLTRAFVSAARVNDRTRRQSQAQNVAQNALEEVQALSWDTIRDTYTTISESQEMSGNVTTAYQREYDVITAEQRTYTVTVYLSPAYEPEMDGYGADDEVTDYNADSLAQIYDMNSAVNASYELPSSEELRMAKQFGGDTEQILQTMERVIYLDIRKLGSKTTVDVNSIYSCGEVTKDALGCAKRIYSGEETLQNIYLFFEPLGEAAGNRERIVIRNWDAVPTGVYLIRQGEDADMSADYEVNVDVLEQNRTAEDYGDSCTKLRTNLISTGELAADRYAHLKLRYGITEDSYQTSFQVTRGGTVNVYRAAELTDLSDLLDQAVTDRVYSVTVTVREKDADINEEVSLNGTKEE